MKLICVCLKNVTECQSLSLWGGGTAKPWRRGQDAAKEPDTQRYAPCLSEPSYRNAAGVISPGLPSQALTRQRPQSGSPWQRDVVFDETDLRLLKTSRTAKASPTKKDSPGRGGGTQVPEGGKVARRSRDGEGKDADKKQKNTAIQALFVSDIVSLCFRVLFCRTCPLRRWRASSPKGRALGKEVKPSCTPPCRGRQADSTPSG